MERLCLPAHENIGRLGAETIGRGDSTTGDSIQAELTCEQFRKVIYDSILGDYVDPPQ